MLVKLDDRENHLLLGGELKPGGMKYRLIEHLLAGAVAARASTVADISTGASAQALAELAPRLGMKARVHVPDSLAREKLERLHQHQAEVHTSPIEKIHEVLKELYAGHLDRSFYWTQQNFAPEATSAYGEIAQNASKVFPIQSLVAGVGTGSSLRSFAQVLLEQNPDLKIYALFSSSIAGLRPAFLQLPHPERSDLGSVTSLRELFGERLEVVELEAGDLGESERQLTQLGIRACNSTAAVHHVIKSRRLAGSLGLSSDGTRPGVQAEACTKMSCPP